MQPKSHNKLKAINLMNKKKAVLSLEKGLIHRIEKFKPYYYNHYFLLLLGSLLQVITMISNEKVHHFNEYSSKYFIL